MYHQDKFLPAISAPISVPKLSFAEWQQKFRAAKDLTKLLVLADFLESGGYRERGGFSISRIDARNTNDYAGTYCGTVCCITGWGMVLEFDYASPFVNWVNDIIPNAVYGELIMPPSYETRPDLYPPSRAAKVLRHLVATGRVEWDLFPSENYK